MSQPVGQSVSKAPYIFTWHYWMHEPKRRKNSGYLLSLNSAWNYNRNYYNCYSYSRFKTIVPLQDYYYYLFYSYYKKVFLSHDNFSSSKTFSRCLQDVLDIFKTPQDVLKMSSRRFQDILESKKLYILEDKKLLCSRCLQGLFKICLEDVFKMSWRPPNVCLVNFVYEFSFSGNCALSL